jgi:small subunit ribosomal protein S6
MRNYELVYIVDSELEADVVTAIEERVNGWIEDAGGKVVKTDRVGKRRLAYPIKKKNEGFYFFLDVEMPPGAGALLERDLSLSEQILRYMITLKPE